MKKKLVFFIGGLNFGGMERVVFIAKELLKDEYDVTIVTLYQNEADYEAKEEYYNLDVPPSHKRIQTVIKRFIQTIRMKKKLKPDIVFSFGMYLNYLNVLSNAFLISKPKTVVGIRSYDWLTDPFFEKKIDKWIMRHANSVNSVSKLIAIDAEKIWGIPTRNNKVIYNPYDVKYIEAMSLEAVSDFVFDERCFYISTMGRLSAQKGYNHLVRAVAEVIKVYPNVRLIIMGNGEKKSFLEDLIKSYGLSDKIILLGGKKNPHKYVRKSNLYVLSSITEGFPNALSETMCVGTPVVAVNCKSGPSEILFDSIVEMDETKDFLVGEYGILSRELCSDESYEIKELDRNEKALVKAICYAYKNPEMLKSMALNARKHMEKFNYEMFKKNMIEALEE